MDIVLASASEERKKLLKKIIKKFEVFPNTAKLRIKPLKEISKIAKNIAYFKALRICLKKPKKIVISADTIVEKNKKLFSKPQNKKQAIEFLKNFSESKIKIYTAFCLAYFSGCSRPKIKCFCYGTSIKLKKIQNKQIHKYLSKTNWKNRAGAIDINDKNFLNFLEGKISSTQKEIIAGLPTKYLKQKLFEFKKLVKNKNR